MLVKARKWAKSKDYFGKETELNINGHECHKTWFGGLTSLGIRVVMIIYVFLLFKKCFGHNEDVVNYTFSDENPEELGEVKQPELSQTMFFQLSPNHRHTEDRTKAAPTIKLDESFYSHVDVYFEQMDINLNDPDESKRVVGKKFEAKSCTLDDWKAVAKDDEQWLKKSEDLWERYKDMPTTLCPKLEDREELILQNDFSMPERKHYSIVFARCTKERRAERGDAITECASKDAIDEYLKKILVHTWVIQEELNLGLYF